MIANTSNRIEVVDALRGLALLSIMLLHHLEHFDFYYFPEQLPDWLKAIDKVIWETMFFLFSGKSYAIFALLFGLTFNLQMSRQEALGVDFRARFLWRLVLLLCFGLVNSSFYQGDILTLYAIWGVVLVVVCRWSNKWVLAAALVLLFQPIEVFKALYLAFNPSYGEQQQMCWEYFGKSWSYVTGNSLWELIKGNFINGRIGVYFWSWENGRFFQAPALFLLGMLLGRKGAFNINNDNLRFWKKIFVASIIAFLCLHIFRENFDNYGLSKAMVQRMGAFVNPWTNFCFMFLLVSGFVLLFQRKWAQKILLRLQPFGRMSLSNYLIQSIIGAFVYYGFGLGLYKYTGATYSFLIGFTLFILQLAFCKWWLKKHKQGPLEYIWHRLTWIGSSR